MTRRRVGREIHSGVKQQRCVLIAIAALLLGGGCATSPLVRPDDPVFRANEQRLGTSEAHLAAPDPLTPDQLLFLQAESYFRYRSAFGQPEGALRYGLEVAAAATDFAPLSVAAASGTQLDLRLRSYDGAAELYETLLARYPHSPLRALTLYRLGWAYRNTSAPGLPRDSEQAFDLVLKEDPGTPLAALAQEGRATPWKSLDTASLLSLIPGAGQLYVGETLNGSIRLGIAVGFAALAVLPALSLIKNQKFSWVPAVLSTIGLVGLEVSYTTAYEDAQRGVLQFNEKVETRFEAAHPDAP